jgi:hypothetical protein
LRVPIRKIIYKAVLSLLYNEEFRCQNVHINLKFGTVYACMAFASACPRLMGAKYSGAAVRVAA